MPDLSRRDFLKLARDGLLALSGLLGLGGLIRFLDYQTEPPPPTDFDLGPASDPPAGTRKVIPDIPALLIHDASGFSALSLVCTHLGCTVEEEAEGFACPCHGSHFDPQGKVTRGPANKPLRSLRVETTEDGHLHLYTA
jgi:nitrite reductase/ring-hydroxylating ferredoxin subunit